MRWLIIESLLLVRGRSIGSAPDTLICVSSILTVPLRMIKGAIGRTNDRLRRIERRRERGEPDADGNSAERLRFAVRNSSVVHLAANAVITYACLLHLRY